MARPRQVSDAQIAAAARAAFLEHGPTVSTEVIAARLGVTAPALFKRMKSKEALLVAAFGVAEEPAFLARLRAGPDRGADLPAQLEAIAREVLVFLRRIVPGLVVLKGSGVALHKGFAPRGPASPAVARDARAKWLAAAQAAGGVRAGCDPRAAADALIGALEARSFLAHLGGARFLRGTDSAYVRTLVATLWHGLAAGARGARVRAGSAAGRERAPEARPRAGRRASPRVARKGPTVTS